ncbi:hypothetical protein [Paraburkholderia sp. GAS199]|uniref:hypothetical protein n=1 Tax=Paraburkholderia sp. GAS199 TaxID=3035126 RepID=UPI003D19DA17
MTIKDKQIASEVAHRLYALSGSINETILYVRENCPAEEFKEFCRAMGQLLDRLYVIGLEPLYEDHPDIAPPEVGFKSRR